MSNDGRLPVLIGLGQVTNRDEVVVASTLIEAATRAALDEAPGVVDSVDAVWIVNVMSGIGLAPATQLAHRIGRPDAAVAVTTVGGNSPAWLVSRAAEAIQAGRLDSVVIAGAEAMRSKRAIKAGAPTPDDDQPAGAGVDPMIGDDRVGISDHEMAAGLMMPIHLYPVFESVLAQRAGRTFAEQRAHLASFMSAFTEVAAKHPNAWFPEPATAADLATVDADNRLVAQPYPKRMNAIMSVDQGAALVITSLERARALGVADRAVFVHSGAAATDVFITSERRDLGSSLGMAAALGATLDAAAVTADDVAHFDLYSCFPAVVQFAASVLGLDLDDPRGLTATGGLAYFGGPGNNYVTHSLATVAQRLRDGDSGDLGLVTALGWFSTKHASVLLGSAPPAAGFVRARTRAAQRAIDGTRVEVSASASGPGVVAGVSVQPDRDGVVTAAPAIVDLADGRRVVAGAADAAEVGDRNPVGATVMVTEGKPPTWRLT